MLRAPFGDQPSIAPDDVGFSPQRTHDSETIEAATHPYITGAGFGGEALGAADFEGWQQTDLGTLTNLPDGTTLVLTNGDGPSWVEYRHGDGRVIVTTLTYCTDVANQTRNRRQRATCLRYSRFFSGSAFTPAPTVTLGPRPTATKSPSPRFSADRESPTLTATLTPARVRRRAPSSIGPTPTRDRVPTATATFVPQHHYPDRDRNRRPQARLTPTKRPLPLRQRATETATELASATPTPTALTPSTPTPSATPTELVPTPTATAVTAACAGDCNGDDVVTVDELLTMVQHRVG